MKVNFFMTFIFHQFQNSPTLGDTQDLWNNIEEAIENRFIYFKHDNEMKHTKYTVCIQNILISNLCT